MQHNPSKYVLEVCEKFTPRNKNSKIKTQKVFDEHGKPVENVTTYITNIEYVDQEKFLKLFVGGVNAIFDLSQASQSVLRVVLLIAQNSCQDKATIEINYNGAVKEYHYDGSSSKFSRGINELIKKDILVKVNDPFNKNLYDYNLNLFFNGDRVDYVQSFILKGNK